MVQSIATTDPSGPRAGESQRASRWLDLAIIVVIVVAAYFLRLTDLTIRGEESRRARVACEMLETGDWIVPRQQGQIYLSRPPLGSWPIAALGLLRGHVDAIAIRLPTVLAVLATTLLIYSYAGTFLSGAGPLAAALAFATMGQVLEIGRLAETEATFTLLVASSLLLWHWGYTRSWTPALYWSTGYALAALAGLAKGPQGPVYFAAPVVMYLLVRRDWRTLVSWPHLVGIAVFTAVIGAWQVPYYLATDWQSVRGIWLNNAAERFADNSAASVVRHLTRYPLEMIVCMLPWSCWLLMYCRRELRQRITGVRDHVLFLAVSIAVTFPSVWLATGAKGRYFMPLYPAFAVLIGIAIERVLEAPRAESLHRAWRLFLGGTAVVACGAAVLIAAATVVPEGKLEKIAQDPAAAVIVIACSLLLATVLMRLRRASGALTERAALAAVASLAALIYAGPVVNSQVRASEDTGAAVARMKRELPSGAQLVSLGQVSHLFAYHYRDPIPVRHLPAPDELHGITYFCFDEDPAHPRQLPAGARRLAVISLERNRTMRPRHTVVVGRIEQPAKAVNAAAPTAPLQ